jgi:uracil-DNA glycosylase
MTDICPYCGEPLVLPHKGRNDYLLVGEFPDPIDIDRGVPFSGESGEILKYELSRLGVNIWDCTLTNLYLHSKNKNPQCFEEGVKSLTLEMAGRKVLLLGAENCKYFTDRSVNDMSGLVVTSPLFPRSVQWVMIANNPAIVLHQPLGEARLAIQKYVNKAKSIDTMQKVLDDNIGAWKELANE